MRSRQLGLLVIVGLFLFIAKTHAYEHVASVHIGSRYEHAVERGGYWYLASQWGLECWQFNQAADFVKLSEVTTPGVASWVAVEGDYAYVADEFEGLSIVDISDPFNLTFVSNFMPWPTVSEGYPGRFYFASVKDDVVYLSGWYGIAVIDVSDHYNPEQIDRIYFTDENGDDEKTSNQVSQTLVVGDYLFATYSNTPIYGEIPTGLYQYDISDPTAIETYKVYPFVPVTDGVFAVKDSLIALASWFNVRLFEFTDGDTLAPRDSLTNILFNFGNPQSADIEGTNLLIAGRSGQLAGGISNIDISNPDSMFFIEDYRLPQNFNMVALTDTVGVAGYADWNLLHLRLNAQGLLDSIGFTSSQSVVTTLAVSGDFLYAADIQADALRVFDISDRVQPWELPSLQSHDVTCMAVFGNRLFVGTRLGRMFAYDITEPDAPAFLADHQMPGSTAPYYDIVLWNDLLFAGRSPDTLEVYDFSEDTFDLVTMESAQGLSELMIRDSVLYTGHDILRINPDTSLTRLTETGIFDYVYGAFDLVDSIYLAASGYNGLGVFDLADLSNPRFITYWDTLNSADPPGDGLDVVYFDDQAFLLDGSWGTTELDVSDHTHPHFVDRITTPGIAWQLHFDDRYFYVADFWGIEIYEYGSLVDVRDTPDPLPKSFTLHQNYPNPFNSTTVISYELTRSSLVELAIYNVLGQRVQTLHHGLHRAGSYRVTWDAKSDNGKEVASGVYFCVLKAGGAISFKKLLLIL